MFYSNIFIHYLSSLGGAFARPQPPTNASTRARGRSKHVRSRVALYYFVLRSEFVHKNLNI